MIDVSPKSNSLRYARAKGSLIAPGEIIGRVGNRTVPKGDVLATARASGIAAAKRTSDWIVFCHPIPLDWVELTFELEPDRICVIAEVRSIWKTGVEMEAITAVSAALLNMYDMLKPLTDSLELSDIRLIEKRGGKSDSPPGIPTGLTAAVVVVSDSTYQGLREDVSGKTIADYLECAGVAVSGTEIVPDEQETIRDVLLRLSEGGKPRLVITTGGTGLGPRDVTPEATISVVERVLDGVSETIRAYGQNRVPVAMLSRCICGVRGNTVIVNLPGSVSAVKDGLQVLLPAILHVFPMMGGEGHDG